MWKVEGRYTSCSITWKAHFLFIKRRSSEIKCFHHHQLVFTISIVCRFACRFTIQHKNDLSCYICIYQYKSSILLLCYYIWTIQYLFMAPCYFDVVRVYCVHTQHTYYTSTCSCIYVVVVVNVLTLLFCSLC